MKEVKTVLHYKYQLMRPSSIGIANLPKNLIACFDRGTCHFQCKKLMAFDYSYIHATQFKRRIPVLKVCLLTQLSYIMFCLVYKAVKGNSNFQGILN